MSQAYAGMKAREVRSPGKSMETFVILFQCSQQKNEITTNGIKSYEEYSFIASSKAYSGVFIVIP